MQLGYPSEEDWVWFDNLPDDLKQRVLRLIKSNNPSAIYHYGYHNGYSRGYNKASRNFKKLVVAHEYGEKNG